MIGPTELMVNEQSQCHLLRAVKMQQAASEIYRLCNFLHKAVHDLQNQTNARFAPPLKSSRISIGHRDAGTTAQLKCPPLHLRSRRPPGPHQTNAYSGLSYAILFGDLFHRDPLHLLLQEGPFTRPAESQETVYIDRRDVNPVSTGKLCKMLYVNFSSQETAVEVQRNGIYPGKNIAIFA
jgi:hypothetical protein